MGVGGKTVFPAVVRCVSFIMKLTETDVNCTLKKGEEEEN